jgi:hypothetical protein
MRLSNVRLQAILPCPPMGRLIALEETTLTGTGANIFILSPLELFIGKKPPDLKSGDGQRPSSREKATMGF